MMRLLVAAACLVAPVFAAPPHILSIIVDE